VSATPPEANYEYSRGPETPERARSRRSPAPPAGRWAISTRRLILAGSLLGVVLLLVAEFSTLYTVHETGKAAAISSEGTGPHHAFAMVPIALLAALLAIFGASRSASRPALLAIGALGLLGLLISVLGDLPDAHAHGLTRGFVLATATPQAGLYLETFGSLILVLVSGLGLVAVTPADELTRRWPRRGRDTEGGAARRTP
jgi:hypothetical protein